MADTNITQTLNPIRAARAKTALTQADVAKAMDRSERTIIRWEAPEFDVSELSLADLRQMAGLFGCDVSDIAPEAAR